MEDSSDWPPGSNSCSRYPHQAGIPSHVLKSNCSKQNGSRDISYATLRAGTAEALTGARSPLGCKRLNMPPQIRNAVNHVASLAGVANVWAVDIVS